MALLTPQVITKAGVAGTFTAVNASDTITPDSNLILRVKNANAAACTVTLDDGATTPGGSQPTDPTVTVPATTGDVMIFIPASFVNPTTGVITVSYSVTASVTAGLFRV